MSELIASVTDRKSLVKDRRKNGEKVFVNTSRNVLPEKKTKQKEKKQKKKNEKQLTMMKSVKYRQNVLTILVEALKSVIFIKFLLIWKGNMTHTILVKVTPNWPN